MNINSLLSSSYYPPREVSPTAPKQSEAKFLLEQDMVVPCQENPVDQIKFEPAFESDDLMSELLRAHFTQGGLVPKK